MDSETEQNGRPETFVTPPPLECGDRIAVIAPASNRRTDFGEVYDLGLERLREVFELEPVEYPTATRDAEYLLENPEQRAQDVMDAFEDPEITGVIAVIGGNDQIRVLKHLDPDVLRANPTRFYGYSDNTNLALYLWNLGIVTYYGPCLMTELAMDERMFEHTIEFTERAFFADSLGALRPATEFTDEPGDWATPAQLEDPRGTEPNPGWQWDGGDDPVSGRLWGGCLEILDQQFIVDRYLPNESALDGTVLALETSEELPDAEWVAGVLRALGERGVLERFAGVLVGRPPARTHLEDRPADEREAYRHQQRQVIEDVFARYNPDAPVVTNVDFGHTWPTTPIPIGGWVEIDPQEETVRFEEG
ncbi:peptidase U61 LD-carboxypeptidase A [Natrialba hulunbeirensis JCM 10989]|uniref:Peptidase U61 LD-carboxypeptidase A n=1 Tax=Natrialba hulunbeirensis JCM 10989 TaxID=1227493 RepID=L9ZMT0_9EURY|nr:S66 peptidase family protein [Natrialba hulunbeirensis]ELY87366.1 peptidase U61 LD-carboxypeptidase A [Natrialba hulunbeirensis JCM 10989]